MTKADLVVVEWQFHSVGKGTGAVPGSLSEARLMARVSKKAPAEIPAEKREAFESLEVKNVEVRMSKASPALAGTYPELVSKALDRALDKALVLFAPEPAPLEGEVLS